MEFELPAWLILAFAARSLMNHGHGMLVESDSLASEAFSLISDIITVQSEMRGLKPVSVEAMPAVSVDHRGRVVLSAPDGWCESMDLSLGNTYCRRCSDLITPARRDHPRELCDYRITRLVMDS